MGPNWNPGPTMAQQAAQQAQRAAQQAQQTTQRNATAAALQARAQRTSTWRRSPQGAVARKGGSTRKQDSLPMGWSIRSRRIMTALLCFGIVGSIYSSFHFGFFRNGVLTPDLFPSLAVGVGCNVVLVWLWRGETMAVKAALAFVSVLFLTFSAKVFLGIHSARIWGRGDRCAGPSVGVADLLHCGGCLGSTGPTSGYAHGQKFRTRTHRGGRSPRVDTGAARGRCYNRR